MDSSTSSINSNTYNFLLAMAVLNILIAIFATSLNLIIIVTFYKTSSLRTPSYLLILGLAVSDFCTGIIAEPVFCALIISYCSGNIQIYTTLYPVEDIVFMTLAPVSFYTLTAITIDRFLAIYFHLRYQLLVTKKRCLIVIAFIWIFGISKSLSLGFVNYEVLSTIDLVLFIALIILNGTLNVVIYSVINRHSAQIKAQEQVTTQSLNMPRYKKTINTMHLIICAFLLCYIPHSSVVIMEAVPFNGNLRTLFTITGTLVMLNSVFNPIIYCWRVPDIRAAAYQMISSG